MSVTDDHSAGDQDACCNNCQSRVSQRPRLVIGVFNDADGANGAAKRLKVGANGCVSVLTGGTPILAQNLDGIPGMLMGCGRLYQQIARHLETGASIVVVDAQSSEQQLGVSRILLESKCDMLLTHDGSRTGD